MPKRYVKIHGNPEANLDCIAVTVNSDNTVVN